MEARIPSIDEKTTLNWLTLEDIEDMRSVKMLSPLITDNRLIMFAANASNGKSSLVFAQIAEIIKNYPGKQVVIADYDQGIHRVYEPIANKVLSLPNVKAVKVGDMETHEALYEYLNNQENIILVIDGFQTLVSRYGVSILSNDDMNPIMEDLKNLRENLGMTVILIHHNNKEDANTKSSVFRGAQVIEDSLDSLFYLKGERDASSLNIKVDIQKFDGQIYYKGLTLNLEILHTGDISYPTDTEEITLVLPKGVEEQSFTEAMLANVNKGKTEMAEGIKELLPEIGLNKIKKTINTMLDTDLFEVYETGIKNKKVIIQKGMTPILLEIPSEPMALDELPANTGALDNDRYAHFATIQKCVLPDLIRSRANSYMLNSGTYITKEEIIKLQTMVEIFNRKGEIKCGK